MMSLVSQREGMLAQLASPVTTLEQLKSTLELLHAITDMQNVIDDMYFPVERLYAMLRCVTLTHYYVNPLNRRHYGRYQV